MDKKVFFQGEELTAVRGSYPGGAPSLQLYDHEGLPYLTATTRIPGVFLEPGETLVKDYAENEGIFAALVAAGIVEDTGRREKGRFVNLPIVRVLL